MENNTTKRRRGRPPKELAGHSETREALLGAGVAALTEKGFSATGIDEILKKVDVPKGSFYHYFKSKEAFGAQLIDRYASYFANRLDRILLDTDHTPLTRLENFVEDSIEGMQRFDFRRGCLVGNLGQEMGALPPSFRSLLIEVFNEWQDKTADCLRSAAAMGEIADTIDCNQAAQFFWIGWEGAVLRAKLEKSERPLRVYAKGFFDGLRQ